MNMENAFLNQADNKNEDFENLKNSFEIGDNVYVLVSNIGGEKEEKGIVKGYEIKGGKLIYNIEILSSGEIISFLEEAVSLEEGVLERKREYNKQEKEKSINFKERISNAERIEDVINILFNQIGEIRGSNGEIASKEDIRIVMVDLYLNIERDRLNNSIDTKRGKDEEFKKYLRSGHFSVSNITNGGELKIRDGFTEFLRKKFNQAVN